MPPPAPASSRRSSPLAPDERRSAILRQIAPLLITEGLNVSTRQLAEAAGIAEGTLFRAFGDKPALIEAAAAHLLDPHPLLARLDAIDPEASLEVRLTEALTALLERVREVGSVLNALHAPAEERDGRSRHSWSGREWFVVPVVRALTRLLEPHAVHLRQPPEAAAWLLTSLTLTAASPAISPSLDAGGLVDLALHGLQTAPALPAAVDVGPRARSC